MKRESLVILLMATLPLVGAQADDQWGGNQCWIKGVLTPVGKQDCPADSNDSEIAAVGPPVIIYRRPSAAGSQMPALSTVDSGFASQLSAIADTPITLRYKGEFAMKHGDLAAAKRYFDEAARRDPDNAQTQQDLATLKGLFDQGTVTATVPHFEASQVLFPMPSVKVKKFEKKYPEVRKLREAELATYKDVAEANAALSAATTANAPATQVSQAQTKLEHGGRCVQRGAHGAGEQDLCLGQII